MGKVREQSLLPTCSRASFSPAAPLKSQGWQELRGVNLEKWGLGEPERRRDWRVGGACGVKGEAHWEKRGPEGGGK